MLAGLQLFIAEEAADQNTAGIRVAHDGPERGDIDSAAIRLRRKEKFPL